MKFSHLPILLIGILIIAVLTPLAQFMTILTVNSSIETATPVGWAVGLLISFVLCGLVVRFIGKRKLLNHQQMAILYTMLTIAVPLMNIGLVRQVYLSSVSVLREYVYHGTSTYQTAYSALSDDWFPLIPTKEGLAWSKVDRLLVAMENRDSISNQQAARRSVFQFMGTFGSEDYAGGEPSPTEIESFRLAVTQMGISGLSDLMRTDNQPFLSQYGLWEPFTQLQKKYSERSTDALGKLMVSLKGIDDWEARLIPANFKNATLSDQKRFERSLEVLNDSQKSNLMERVSALEKLEPEIREEMAHLSQADRSRLQDALQNQIYTSLFSLTEEELAFQREAHLFQLSRDERRRLFRQDGSQGPNQNIWAFQNSFWEDVGQRKIKEQSSFLDNMNLVISGIPWQIWIKPMLMWGLLLTILFLFVICMAEVLRRRWVDRENLTFPLVDVADGIIRHDYDLENTSDAQNPQKRNRLFSPMFLIGVGIGFLILFLEALYHYNFITVAPRLAFDFNQQIFNQVGGPFRSLDEVVFVLSPIVIGLAFLLSLEISFSIWVSFFALTFFSWNLGLAFPEIKDSTYTGFDGGKSFPFIMEQMFGACVCFASYHLFRLFRRNGNGKGGNGNPEEASSFLPRRLANMGVWIFPLIALGLLWHMGLKSIPLLIAFFLFILFQMVAAARIRSETGMPTTHVHYEMSKMPLIFGMTEMTGSKVYTAFLNVAFLPGTLLFRSLPVCLENLELARRFKLSYRTVVVATLAAFFTSLIVGGTSFLLFAYYWGGEMYGYTSFPAQGSPSAVGIATYPLWVAHFLGEAGLDDANQLNTLRISVMVIGAGITGLLILFRQKFLRFPIHPVGYLVVLCSVYFNWCTQYIGVDKIGYENSILWGGVLVAWIIKKVILKYGGMIAYKKAKPLFIGLVVGSVACIFFWNSLDLFASLIGRSAEEPGGFIRNFMETIPYMPQVY